MKTVKNNTTAREEQALLRFLKQTKEGKYAKIDESSMDYVRVREERETIDSFTETYYYSLS